MPIGDALLHGLMPYRDLVDHKGPLLYFIHTIGAFISNRTFIGIWCLEIIWAFIFLVFSFKTIKLFYPKANVLFLIPLAFISYSSIYFYGGDSTEEICLPFWAYTIFLTTRCIRADRLPSKTETLLIGLFAGIIFWIKFLHCAIFVGWFLFCCVDAYKKAMVKCFIIRCLYIILGLIISTLPICAFFAYNGALTNLFDVYLGCNLFNYGGGISGRWTNIIGDLTVLFYTLTPSPVTIITIIASFLIIWNHSKIRLAYLLLFLFPLLLFVYVTGGQIYYYFPLVAFVVLGTYIITFHFYNELRAICRKNIASLLILFISILACIELNNWSYSLLKDKNDFPQYRFAKIINEKENATLLEYVQLHKGMQSFGFYTAAGVVPSCKFFCLTGAYPLDLQVAYQDSMINAGCFDFLVSSQCDLKFDYYTPIDSLDGYYLYKHK